jgi:hypothetical protein
LVCGENDLFEYSVQQTFQNYQNVVLAYINSGAKVFSVSTKPEPSTTSFHSKYRKLDNLIKEWAATDLSPTDFVFIDSYYGFVNLGNSNNLYDSDRLHLSTLGYSYWEEWLNTALEDSNNSCQLWRSGECVSSPPSNDCDDTSLAFKITKDDGKKINRRCSWVAQNVQNRCSFNGVSETCPNSCGSCDECKDSPLKFKIVKNDQKVISRSCTWVAKNKIRRCSFGGVSEACRVTCGNC